LICFSGTKTYTFNGLPQGSTILWTKSSNISIVNQTTNTVTVTGYGTTSGSGWIRGAINTPCGYAIQKSVWVGKFESTVVTGTSAVCSNSLYTYTAQVPGGHSSSYSYSLTYPSNWYNNGQYQNSINLQTPSSPQYGAVRVSITNSCGTSGYSGITVYPNYNCGGYFSLFPNPADAEINIEINESALKAQSDSLGQDYGIIEIGKSFQIRIYNSMGFLVKSTSLTGLKFLIPIGDLIEGNYIVEINDGKFGYRKTFIIKR
jgi:hypothetical protein